LVRFVMLLFFSGLRFRQLRLCSASPVGQAAGPR
jgi:hypothetical protein